MCVCVCVCVCVRHNSSLLQTRQYLLTSLVLRFSLQATKSWVGLGTRLPPYLMENAKKVVGSLWSREGAGIHSNEGVVAKGSGVGVAVRV